MPEPDDAYRERILQSERLEDDDISAIKTLAGDDLDYLGTRCGIARAPTITAEITYRALKIRFGGALHVRIDREDFPVTFQAWEFDTRFYIEYNMREGKEMTCDYDRREHWLAILAELDRLL